MMKKIARMPVLALAAFAIACASPVHAQTSTTTARTTTTTTTTTKTPIFATKAAVGGLAEVQMGQMAADKATDPDVKAFAQRMVTDHSKANDELHQLASTKGWTLPAALDAKHRAAMTRLGRFSGTAFDRQYMNAMVADHNADVAAFRAYSKSGADAELKTWAGNTLPTLEEHQKMSKETAAKLGRSAGK